MNMLKYYFVIIIGMSSLSVFADTNFDGFACDVRYSKNQISLNIGSKSIGRDAYEIMGILLNQYNNDFSINTNVDLWLFDLPINTGRIKVDYSIQLNLLGIDIIPQDNYNNNEINASGLPTLISTGWLIVIQYARMSFGNGRNDDDYIGLMALPAAFINSVHSVSLLDNFNNNEYNDLSIFLHSKLDYYMKNEIDFFRYQPEIGFQYTYIKGNDNSFGFSGSVGVKFIVDYVHNDFVYKSPMPSMSLCFYFGSLRN